MRAQPHPLQIKQQRRVSITSKHRTTTIAITRHGDFLGLIVPAVFACVTCYAFVPVLLRSKSAKDFFVVLLVCLPFALISLSLLRISLQAAFGTEEIQVSGDTLVWTRKLSFWTRTVTMQQNSIASVLAKSPWYGRHKHVEIISNGKEYEIGDELLLEEALEIAGELRAALRR